MKLTKIELCLGVITKNNVWEFKKKFGATKIRSNLLNIVLPKKFKLFFGWVRAPIWGVEKGAVLRANPRTEKLKVYSHLMS